MIRKIVIFLSHLASGTGGGIKVYCDALRSLFLDDDALNVIVCPILPMATKFVGNKYNIKEIECFLDIEKPDAIHINGYASLIVSQLVPLALKKKIKIVYTPHWHPFETMRLSILKKIHFDIFVKPHLKDMDAIVNINKEEYSFFSNLSKHTTLIPHWNLGKFHKDLTIDKNKNMILFVGNLFYKNKGVDYLFRLPEGKYDIHCVGRGNLCLRKDMTQHQNISDAELNTLYNVASLVVIPSKYEAFSYTALEALTCGTPIVVSDNVRFADFIDNCPECAVFKFGNYDDFKSKVEATIGVSVNIDSVTSKFSQSEAKNGYKNLYLSLFK